MFHSYIMVYSFIFSYNKSFLHSFMFVCQIDWCNTNHMWTVFGCNGQELGEAISMPKHDS